jgi:hypothetical protein
MCLSKPLQLKKGTLQVSDVISYKFKGETRANNESVHPLSLTQCCIEVITPASLGNLML